MSYGAEGILYRIPPPKLCKSKCASKAICHIKRRLQIYVYMQATLTRVRLPVVFSNSLTSFKNQPCLKKWRHNQAARFENQWIQLVYLWIREKCYLRPSEFCFLIFFETGEKNHTLFKIQHLKPSCHFIFLMLRQKLCQSITRAFHNLYISSWRGL